MMLIDGKQFSLFTDDDTAWGGDARTDSALVTAMKAGTSMTVRGTSARGTLTTDTYSLAGFTAAHAAIDKACDAQEAGTRTPKSIDRGGGTWKAGSTSGRPTASPEKSSS
jgi:hypothetical protein